MPDKMTRYINLINWRKFFGLFLFHAKYVTTLSGLSLNLEGIRFNWTYFKWQWGQNNVEEWANTEKQSPFSLLAEEGGISKGAYPRTDSRKRRTSYQLMQKIRTAVLSEREVLPLYPSLILNLCFRLIWFI